MRLEYQGCARDLLPVTKNWRSKIIQCAYRPFDYPYCFFGTEFMDYPRRELIDHVAGEATLYCCIQTNRDCRLAARICSGRPSQRLSHLNQSSEANYVFPLWRFRSQREQEREFAAGFRSFVDARYEHHYTAEEILGYIYAVLYAPIYRAPGTLNSSIDFPVSGFQRRLVSSKPCRNWAGSLIQAHCCVTCHAGA